MRLLRNMLVATLVLGASPVIAQDNGAIDALMRRDSILPPVLTWLQQQGSKLTFIGEEAGLKGYLVESPKGTAQVVYVAPDGKHIVLGLLFEQGGKNVTGIQIGEMRRRFDNAAKALGDGSASVFGNGDTESSQGPSGKSDQTEPSSWQVEPAVDADKTPESAVDGSDGLADVTPSVTTHPAANDVNTNEDVTATPATEPSAAEAAPVSLPEATATVEGADGNPSDVWASKIDRDQFLKSAEATPYFEVGSRVAPVTLWMVADPKCPYCHEAWRRIENFVFDKKVKVRVILINALNGSEPFAREILASASPARRWIESKAGSNLEPKIDPSSKEWQDTEKYLTMNMSFAQSFGIDRTPFLAYVADDGRFYSVFGLPSSLDSFLSASGAVPAN